MYGFWRQTNRRTDASMRKGTIAIASCALIGLTMG